MMQVYVKSMNTKFG